jgi:hypothetical protein
LGRVKFGFLDVLLDDHDRVDQQNVLVAWAAANFGESTLGVVVTNGDPEANGNNTVAGAAFVYRNSNFRGGQTLRASVWAQVSVNDPDKGPTADSDAIKGTGYAYGFAVRCPNNKHN